MNATLSQVGRLFEVVAGTNRPLRLASSGLEAEKGRRRTLPTAELMLGLCLFLLSTRLSAGGDYSLARSGVMFFAASLIILYGAYRNPYAPIYCYAFLSPIYVAFGTSIALVLGGAALVMLKRREIEWEWKFSWVGVAFNIWTLSSLAWAQQRYFGQDSYIAQAVPPMVLAVVISGIRDPVFRRNLVLMVVAGCTIGSAFSLRHYRLGIGDYGGGRVFGLIRPDIFSAWEIFGILGGLAWLLSGRLPKRFRLLLAASLLVVIAGTGLCCERAAILAAGFGVLVMSLCRRQFLQGVSTIVLIGFVILVVYLVQPGIFDPVLARFQSVSEDRGSDRLEIWGAALRVFAESPLFGTGVENFRFSVGRYYGAEFLAHSIYIGTLVELGVVGFSLMACWFLVLLRKSWQAEDRLWVFPLLLAYLCQAAFLHEFHFGCFWLALGLAEGSRSSPSGMSSAAAARQDTRRQPFSTGRPVVPACWS